VLEPVVIAIRSIRLLLVFAGFCKPFFQLLEEVGGATLVYGDIRGVFPASEVALHVFSGSLDIGKALFVGVNLESSSGLFIDSPSP
jgi:hypothetical protein